MRLLLLPLVVIAFVTSVQAQEVIEWNEKRKLTYTDFKNSPALPLSKTRIITRYALHTTLDSTRLPISKTLNACVTTLFYPEDSWIDETNKTAIQYSNTIFDIYEWSARALRKRLAENREWMLTGNFESITNELEQEFASIIDAYDTESEYGTNLFEQMKWESRITQQLLMLSAYCKTYGEVKIN